MKWVVIISPGSSPIGPFDTTAEAQAWAKLHLQGVTTIVVLPLLKPW